MQKTKQPSYPLLLSAELVSLIDSLSVLHRLVATDTDNLDEELFCQQVTDSLIGHGGIESVCVYSMLDGELAYVAGSSHAQDKSDVRHSTSEHARMAHRCWEVEGKQNQGVSLMLEDECCLLGLSLGYGHEKLGSIVLGYADADSFHPWHERFFRLCGDIITQSLLILRLTNRLSAYSSGDNLQPMNLVSGLSQQTISDESADSTNLESADRDNSQYPNKNTCLLDPSLFHKQLRSAVIEARSFSEDFSLLILDIDHFQVINEVAGHAAGDRLISAIANQVLKGLPSGSHCARLGTDEFGILLRGKIEDETMEWIQRLQAEIKGQIFESGDDRFTVNTSIGMVPLQKNCPDAAELIRMAYSACQCVQEQKLGVQMFNMSDSRMQRRRNQASTLKRLIRAIEDNALELYCQPILKIDDWPSDGRNCQSGEILVRIRDDQNQLVPAGEMLELAERYGFAPKLDQRILAQALDMLTNQKPSVHGFEHLAINLSAHSIGNGEFLKFLVDAISNSPVDPKKLCFEITETAAILDIQSAARLINIVKELGCTFALDDFGSGYASYLYLRDLPVDYLKIDGEFVRDMVSDSVNLALVRTMVDIGKILGKQIVAEFVENKATLDILREIGVDFVQGYYIGRPRPFEDFLNSIQRV